MGKLLRLHRHSSNWGAVKIRNANSIKGGIDKQCSIVIHSNSATLVSKTIHVSHGGALRVALRKLVSKVKRRFERRELSNKYDRRKRPVLKFVPNA